MGIERKCPLDVYFEEEECWRARDAQGDTGTVIGWSKPIKLSCPMSADSVGGWWWFKRDRDGATVGVHPKMIKKI
jgi:hypothetical protein